LAGFWGEVLPGIGRRHGFEIDCRSAPFGKGAHEATGRAVPEATLEAMKRADAVLLAAVDAKGLPESPIGFIRRQLDLYADIRPVKARPGGRAFAAGVDLVFVREASQGFLPDRNMHNGGAEWMTDPDTALSMRLITRSASERIARRAFEYARGHGRKKITALHKATVLKKTCGLFLEAVRAAAASYPEIELEEELVDDAANGLIAHPESYDVLLATNLFGDILSDEAAALAGSLAASANLGEGAAVFLPVRHGPCYNALAADEYDVMPAALGAEMLLRFLGENRAAAEVEAAIAAGLSSGVQPASGRLDRLRRALENGA
jgi:isocitrate/isopropylmalate dehydrogenase